MTAGDGEPVLVAIVSDGAGSAARGEAGARLACSLFVDEMAALFEIDGSVLDITREFAQGWLMRFQNAVALRAEAEELAPRDFACTTLAAVLAPACAAFLQIGDGAIVVAAHAEAGEYRPVFWPQRGEYENTTTFATEEAALEQFEFAACEEAIDEVALFTDGLQRLALHFHSQSAYTPLFRPMFAAVRAVPEGLSETLSISLAAFLDSRPVNERTDDDKTLVLATRRVIAPLPVPAEDACGAV
jgi:hypothetical protein